ncbi:hypothetical protein LXA43DRAFT_1027175, partial [Ganoderma leucocontextum]
MPKLHHPPPRPSDLAVRHARPSRTPQDHFFRVVLAQSEQGEGHPFELRRTTYSPEGIFQDPDTHKLVLSVHPPLPTMPLVVYLDSYDGNDRREVASRESPMQSFCVANALRERAWRMGCQSPSDRAILILLRLALVRYLDSFLVCRYLDYDSFRFLLCSPENSPARHAATEDVDLAVGVNVGG